VDPWHVSIDPPLTDVAIRQGLVLANDLKVSSLFTFFSSFPFSSLFHVFFSFMMYAFISINLVVRMKPCQHMLWWTMLCVILTDSDAYSKSLGGKCCMESQELNLNLCHGKAFSVKLLSILPISISSLSQIIIFY
jgi:hypothetical protein